MQFLPKLLQWQILRGQVEQLWMHLLQYIHYKGEPVNISDSKNFWVKEKQIIMVPLPEPVNISDNKNFWVFKGEANQSLIHWRYQNPFKMSTAYIMQAYLSCLCALC